MMEEITKWLIFALWMMSAGTWLPNVLQVVWWRFNSWGYLSSWIANLGLSWLVVWVLPHYGLLPELPDYGQFWLLMVLGLVVYVPITFLTPPDDMEHLVRYYVQSRPVGWWGPVRREAEQRGLIRAVTAGVEKRWPPGPGRRRRGPWGSSARDGRRTRPTSGPARTTGRSCSPRSATS
jgi:hypothetical protein